MSAGSGVFRSEYNFAGGMLRFLQIWFLPDQKNYPPDYGDVQFGWKSRINRRLPIFWWLK
ncbi:MAG: hypothetical protein LBB91_11760 [Clostridiales bacterium]|jgi:redox-sensitive bicupin YhaK (pirin superfamily)|nr:hypothetical protein [Clostridiales bacterium]